MFEPLDPPQEFRPDDAFRAKVSVTARRRRRHQRLAAGSIGIVVVLVVVVGTVAAYGRHELDKVQRVTVASLPPKPVASGKPFNLLVVGIDSDAGLAATPEPGTYRTDTIAIVHVDPAAHTVRELSIPRDLWVKLAGSGQPGRINQAIEAGPANLVGTIHHSLGITVDHVAMVDFAGFEKVVDAVHGLRLDFAGPTRAQFSTDLSVPAGCQTLDGEQALAFARTRKDYEVESGGRWQFDRTGDFGRIARQQAVGLAFVEAFQRVAADPVADLRLVQALLPDVTVDSGFSTGALLELVRELHGLQPGAITFSTVPTREAVVDGADVLELVPGSELALLPFQPPGTSMSFAPAAGTPGSVTTPATAPQGPPPASPFVPTPC